MTGYNSSHFRHHCGQRGCYIKQLPNWDDLISCFPRGIRPTDVDGLVEINRNFLFLEEKSAGAGLLEGQRRTLRNLSQVEGITTVCFRPLRDAPATDLEVLIFSQAVPDGWQRRSRTWLKDWLRDWAANADLRGAA